MIRFNIVVSNQSWWPKTCQGLKPEQWLPKLWFSSRQKLVEHCDAVKLELKKDSLIGFANDRRFVNSTKEGLSVYH